MPTWLCWLVHLGPRDKAVVQKNNINPTFSVILINRGYTKYK